MKRQPKTHILGFMLVFAVLLVVSVGTSCNRKNSTRISSKERDQLLQIQRESNDLQERLESHFQDKGYTFNLAFESSGGTTVSALLRRPTLLYCRGTSDEEIARDVDAEIRRLLSPEELQGLKILYELKDYGYTISAEQLPTFRRY